MNENSPMPYALMKSGGHCTSGIYELTEEMKAKHIPPHWLTYIYVENVDIISEIILKNGGKIIQPAFDVESVGRMAVAQDPAGGVFAVWKAAEKASEMPKGLNTSCWYELGTTDAEASLEFYKKVFNWDGKVDNSMGMDYWVLSVNEQMIAGLYNMPASMKGFPPNWYVYFAVANYDETAKKAVGKGAKVLGPVMNYEGIGKFAYMQDPQGAVFAIIETPAKK
jgi:hypothetical protein